MPVIAIAATLSPASVAEHAGPIAACPAEVEGFAADGRCSLAGADRSAWACPGFYLAIPACGLLMIAVLVVRLCCGLGRVFR